MCVVSIILKSPSQLRVVFRSLVALHLDLHLDLHLEAVSVILQEGMHVFPVGQVLRTVKEFFPHHFSAETVLVLTDRQQIVWCVRKLEKGKDPACTDSTTG